MDRGLPSPAGFRAAIHLPAAAHARSASWSSALRLLNRVARCSPRANVGRGGGTTRRRQRRGSLLTSAFDRTEMVAVGNTVGSSAAGHDGTSTRFAGSRQAGLAPTDHSTSDKISPRDGETSGAACIMKRVLATIICAAALGVAASVATAQTLNTVKTRGVVNCGSNPGLAGFGQPDAQGNWTGFDVDFCRAIAAAIFNDPTKVKFVPLTAKDRFTALQSGEVDLLARNTTWTSSRDTSLGLNFTGVNYYDGQGFIVRKALKVNSALELSGASICVQQGTTTELNLADYFGANKMQLKTVT